MPVATGQVPFSRGDAICRILEGFQKLSYPFGIMVNAEGNGLSMKVLISETTPMRNMEK